MQACSRPVLPKCQLLLCCVLCVYEMVAFEIHMIAWWLGSEPQRHQETWTILDPSFLSGTVWWWVRGEKHPLGLTWFALGQRRAVAHVPRNQWNTLAR